jgi:hypothetical protein
MWLASDVETVLLSRQRGPRREPGTAAVITGVSNQAGRRERRWGPMREGVSDLWRSYQGGIVANRRSLDALAAAP